VGAGRPRPHHGRHRRPRRRARRRGRNVLADLAGGRGGAFARSDVEGEAPHEFVSRLARFEFTEDGGDPIASVGPVKVLASAEIDAHTVAARLEQRREELRAEVARAEGKLANEKFVAKAPPELVEEERGKLERYRAELEELSE